MWRLSRVWQCRWVPEGIFPGIWLQSPACRESGSSVSVYPYGVKYRELRKEWNVMENVKNVFIQAIDKPVRKVIIKRGIKAGGLLPL